MDASLSGHKLCGFLCAVLSVSPSRRHPNPREALDFSARCDIFGDGPDVGFRCSNGVVFTPIDSSQKPPVNDAVYPSISEQCNIVAGRSGVSGRESCSRKRKGRNVGQVNGSSSVVHQLHALVNRKCIRIDARVLWDEVDGSENGGEARVVLLVDVYLPVELWGGWQFPKSGSIAGSLFGHLSCDWGRRSSMLSSAGIYKEIQVDDKSIWELSDCHVLGCKVHNNLTNPSKKRLFELHEIFKRLPSVGKREKSDSSRIQPNDDARKSGIWEISDDILVNILSTLGPEDLLRVAATCRHLRFLAAAVMPSMKLKLFPHQQAAVEWMLYRERNAQVLPHPLYVGLVTEDGFSFYVNSVSGEIVTDSVPSIKDFCGGMFCDEPGMGKTVTALSLILKTLGTLPDPPEGAEVIWCQHKGDQRCGYYELTGNIIASGNMTERMNLRQDTVSNIINCDDSSKRARLMTLDENMTGFDGPFSYGGKKSPVDAIIDSSMNGILCTGSLSSVKRNLCFTREEPLSSKQSEVGGSSHNVKPSSYDAAHATQSKPVAASHGKRYTGKSVADCTNHEDTWVQCDACHKWRKLAETDAADASSAWFCSMNTNPLYQSCSAPEESWHRSFPITYLPGFHSKGTSGGDLKNVLFFTSVLKEHYKLLGSKTKKALIWLANLSPDKLAQMETSGLRGPFMSAFLPSNIPFEEFHEIYQAFGLVKELKKGVCLWYYPQNLENLAFDVVALRIALSHPLPFAKLFLSRATLIVVPSNLVDHWKTQIEKHIKSGQLSVYIWNDDRKPSAHSLAWDYDIVITTFNRLSAEWSPRKKTALKQVHWHRVMLDEGHTLGSSLSLTNKLQMAISLVASTRWILTGTPMRNTPNSQLSSLQPLLKFLHEEAYGKDHKSWEAGILRPFEAEMEEGRSRLLCLLHRCMISARKVNLHTIPPCIKKVVFLNFNEKHAQSYNELVLTVRRNILMADWNDPSHVESLLNPKQWKFRSATIKNLRLSCCVAGHIKVTHAGEDIQETMDIFAESGVDPASEEYSFIRYSLLHGGNCVRCGEWCRLPVITPCRHLLCLDCVALDSMRCTYPGCGNLYEMQSPDMLTRPENPNPKWPVPKDLIELQPSYKQDDWDPDWQSTSSSKVSYLVERLKALQEANMVAGCHIHGGKDLNHPQEFGLMQLCDKEETLQDRFRVETKNRNINPEKVMIFSQFLEHIHVIEQQLTMAGIKYAGMYSPMHSSNKKKALSMFQHDPSCLALMMDGSAALGLDLSFVTRVFLMEPIWDRSVEEQVISRAHRMGATRPIHVETLAMHGTIEEQMLQFLQDEDKCGKSDNENGRGYRSFHDFAESNYLSKLSFVRTNPRT